LSIAGVKAREVFMEFGVRSGREERWASALGGAALLIWGVKKMTADRTPGAALLTTAGAGLICHAAWQRSNGRRGRRQGAVGTIVEAVAAINRAPEELYGYWRNLGNLPRLMPELASVEVLDARRSHWVAHGPARSRPEWHADIINDVPNELIAWRTTPTSDVVSAGSVRFEPAPIGRGTLVRIKLQYDPPGGRLGKAAAWAMGESPGQVIREGLRRFKQLMESGEIATTEGQPRGAQ